MVEAAATGALAEPLEPVAAPEPPSRDLTPAQWVRANLFASPLDAAITAVVGALTGYLLYRLARWAFVTTDWEVVRVNLRLFMVGRFPVDELWRVWASGYVLAGTLGLASGLLLAGAARAAETAGAEAETRATAGARAVAGAGAAAGAGAGPADATDATAADRGQAATGEEPGRLAVLRRFWPLALAAVVVLSFTRTVLPTVLTLVLVAVFLGGRLAGARVPAGAGWVAWPLVATGVVASLLVITVGGSGVGWDDWGGMHLAVAATVAGIALAFPLGLLLALGRRSALPGIRAVSTAYIEMMRAVPLVTLLFVGRYMIGFLFPTQVEPPSYLVRAVIAITLFEAAYIAEIVRGGLQAVPRGQVEAAQAVGLSPPKVLRLVVLPQALRAVIPAMVGQFISLFKDTSLLSVVGFLEILTVAEVATEQPAFRGQGLQVLTFAFAGFLYWAGCSTMARESRRLERRLRVGER